MSKQLSSTPFDLRSGQCLGLLLLDTCQFFTNFADGIGHADRIEPSLFKIRREPGLLSRLFCFLLIKSEHLTLDVLQRLPQGPKLFGQQRHFDHTDFPLQGLIGSRLARLPLKRIQLLLDLGHDVSDTEQILLRRFQLTQRFGLLLFVTHDTGCLLDQLTPVLRRRVQDLIDLPLGDHRVPFASRARIEQQAANILEPAVDLIEEILAFAVTVQSASNHHLLHFGQLVGKTRASVELHHCGIKPADDQRDFGHSQRLSELGPVENDILHLFTSERLGTLFTQYPEDGIHNVAFPASIRTDDRGHTLGKFNLRLSKRLEARHVHGL